MSDVAKLFSKFELVGHCLSALAEVRTTGVANFRV